MYEISVIMKKKYDWFAFRNETATRLIASLDLNKINEYPNWASNAAIKVANCLTEGLMNLGDKDPILQKLNEDNKLKTSRRRNGNS